MLRSRYFTFVNIALCLSVSACSSPSVYKVLSSPSDAEVSFVDSTGVSTKIGKTPLNAGEGDIFKNSLKYTQLRIKHEGYLDQDIVLTKPTFSGDITVNLLLKKEERIQSNNDIPVMQEKLASQLAQANGLIKSKQYTEAETLLQNFVDQFPSVSVGFDYLGNLNYLQNKYSKALKFYNKALSINPTNNERKIIIEKIQSLIKSQTGDAQ